MGHRGGNSASCYWAAFTTSAKEFGNFAESVLYLTRTSANLISPAYYVFRLLRMNAVAEIFRTLGQLTPKKASFTEADIPSLHGKVSRRLRVLSFRRA